MKFIQQQKINAAEGEEKDSSGTEGYSLNVLYIAYRLLALCAC